MNAFTSMTNPKPAAQRMVFPPRPLAIPKPVWRPALKSYCLHDALSSMYVGTLRPGDLLVDAGTGIGRVGPSAVIAKGF